MRAFAEFEVYRAPDDPLRVPREHRVAVWWHDFVSPRVGSRLEFTPDEPPDRRESLYVQVEVRDRARFTTWLEPAGAR